MTTTIFFPTNSLEQPRNGEVSVARFAGSNFSGATFQNLEIAGASATLSNGFALYFALSSEATRSVIDVAAATSALSQNGPSASSQAVPIYINKPSQGTPTSTTFLSPHTLVAGETILVPVTSQLSSIVTLTTFAAQLEAALRRPSSPPTSSSASSQSAASSIPAASSTSSDPAASSSPPTDTPVSEPSSIAKGALAGGIVGAFIGGLLLGALIFFCLGRRRKRGARKMEEASTDSVREIKTPILNREESKTGGGFELARQASTNYSGWRKHVPQAESEATMRNKFMQLSQFITMHVEQHYDSRNIASSSNLTRLAALEPGSTIRLEKVKDVYPFLNRTIASFIIARISLRSDPADSFLPTEFTTIPKMNDWSMEAHDSTESDGRRGVLPALADWRVLTAFLFKDDEQAMNSDLKVKRDRAIRLLDAELADHAKQRRSPDRERSLEQIIALASTAGRELFKQPQTFQFDWFDHQTKHNEDSIVIFPALLRVRDETGRKIQAETVFEATRKKI